MKNFTVLRWEEVELSEILQLMDVVGLWNYSKSMKQDSYYKVTKRPHEITVESPRTSTVFKFDRNWRPRFWHVDEDNHPISMAIEGQLNLCFDYIEKLLELKIIKFNS